MPPTPKVQILTRSIEDALDEIERLRIFFERIVSIESNRNYHSKGDRLKACIRWARQALDQ